MAKYLDSKCKLCRRAGEKLFLKGERCNGPKCAILKRNYPPGFHGPKGKNRLTDYALQLNEKQKAKRQYNMLEKQFKLTFERAKKKQGNAGENFLILLEMRLDNAVFRSGFASSRSQARQLINHGHFTVNGGKVDIASYTVKTGDVIAIKTNKKDSKIFNGLGEKAKQREIPGWINFDFKILNVKILHEPKIKELNSNFNVQQIVEYYSR